MSFRRLPFQFTATDPAERQRELRKRFGLPVSEAMYVDFASSSGMGAGARESNSASSSPRLQHRVPIFVEGSEPTKSSVDSNNTDGGKKPRVRIIPIEVEGAKSPTTNRQRTYSGPAGLSNEGNYYNPFLYREPFKCSMQDITMPNKVISPTEPRVCNVPIQIEGRDSPASKVPRSTTFGRATSGNGCSVSKISVETSAPKEQSSELDISIPVKKIDAVVLELKSYEAAVANFTGTVKDKQYRLLDEMLTRCMLKLDDIETLGNETVRMVRKAAVRKVQDCIDLLESKVSVVKGNKIESTSNAEQDTIEKFDQNGEVTTEASKVTVNVEVTSELKEGSIELISNENKTILDSEIKTKNQEMENSQTESEAMIVDEEVPGQVKSINKESKVETMEKIVGFLSDVQAESNVEMTDEEIMKTKLVPSSTSEQDTNERQQDIPDENISDDTQVQEHKQDSNSIYKNKTTNVAFGNSNNASSAVVNGIHPELHKLSSDIQLAENEVCDNPKHPTPHS